MHTNTIILIKYLSQHVILGIPFLHNIMPIGSIDIKSINATYKQKSITFEFIANPHTSIVNEVKKYSS